MSRTIFDKCNDLDKNIWELFIKEQAWVSGEDINGSKNCKADFLPGSFGTM